MNSAELLEIINTLTEPIYQIEADLGMPKTTLNKALKNGRGLPRKWAVKFKEKYGEKITEKKPEEIELPKEVQPEEVITPKIEVQPTAPEPEIKTKLGFKVRPPKCVRQPGETKADFINRQIEHNKKLKELGFTPEIIIRK